MKKLLLINGPNLNMLGRRDETHYGTFTLQDVEEKSTAHAKSLGYELICFQSNHEGALIDVIHQYLDIVSGLIINAGAYTHYSYALADALELCMFPCIEVHISNIENREAFRQKSVIRKHCNEVIFGRGLQGYLDAIDMCVELLNE